MMASRDYDVVVVGAGNAALCAALAARETGARVLVLERAPRGERGGNSYFTDGAIRFAYEGLADIRRVIPEISDEEAERVDVGSYSRDAYLEDMIRVTDGRTDRDLARRLVEESYPTIEWMHRQGVRFALLYKNQSFESNGRYRFWGGLTVKTVGQGIGLIESLFERAREMGVDVWYEARGVAFVKEGEAVAGIVAERSGERVSVRCGAVVLAAGGFEANPEMRAQHLGSEWKAAIVRGTRHNTGDGINMAVEAGAQTYGDWQGCHSIATDVNAPKVGDFSKPGDVFKKHSYPLGIILNKRGQRFVDEGADFRNYTYAKYGREVLIQPDHVAYQVFDAKVSGMLREEYEREEATRIEAGTLEELADRLDIDRDRFLETVREYNSAVMEGDYNPHAKDGKGTRGIEPPKSNWALTIDEPPYICFPVTCGITFTFGALRVSPDSEVMAAEGRPIPGLYAAGELVGGLFHGNYPGGSGLMSGATFGKIAGSGAASFALSAGGGRG
jgi:tricarballylate dehydrogenase